MELSYYMILSTLEGIGVFYLTLTMFRFRIRDYLFPLILINVLIAFFSFTIREELSLVGVAPIIQLILLAFFIQVLIRIPLIWSVIMASSGIITFALLQTIVLFGLVTLKVVDLESVRGNTIDTYITQVCVMIVIYTLSYHLFRRGYGFTFNFGTFAIRWENIWMLVLQLVVFIGFGFIFLMKNLLLATLIFFICLVFFLIYHFRRELKR